jgi:hypothetical protein
MTPAIKAGHRIIDEPVPMIPLTEPAARPTTARAEIPSVGQRYLVTASTVLWPALNVYSVMVPSRMSPCGSNAITPVTPL